MYQGNQSNGSNRQQFNRNDNRNRNDRPRRREDMEIINGFAARKLEKQILRYYRTVNAIDDITASTFYEDVNKVPTVEVELKGNPTIPTQDRTDIWEWLPIAEGKPFSCWRLVKTENLEPDEIEDKIEESPPDKPVITEVEVRGVKANPRPAEYPAQTSQPSQ